MFRRVNKKLLLMKIHFFLFNGAIASITPYLAIFGRQLGFSSFNIGLIYTILPICGVIAKPIIIGIADSYKSRKSFLLTLQLLAAVSFIAILYSPPLPSEHKINFSCNDDTIGIITNSVDLPIDEDFIKNIRNKNDDAKCSLYCKINEETRIKIEKNWNTSIEEITESILKLEAIISRNDSELISKQTVSFGIEKLILNDSVIDQKCSNKILLDCNIHCTDDTINELTRNLSISSGNTFHYYQFWIFLVLMTFTWIINFLIISLADTICYQLLENISQYGNQRLYGSIGWGLISPFIGFLIDKFSNKNSLVKNYAPAFYFGFILILLDALISSRIQYKQEKTSQNVFKDVFSILNNIQTIIFLLWCISIGMCTGFLWHFHFWLIEDLAKSKKWVKTLEGVIQSVQMFGGEIPIFFFSGIILKKLGDLKTMSFILLVFGLRLFLYSVIPNPWYFIPVELLNGVTFGLFYTCMTSYASIIAPPGAEATIQSIVGSLFEGVGMSLGSLLGGTLYEKFGGPITYRCFGIGLFVIAILHISTQFFIKSDRYGATRKEYKSPNEAIIKLENYEDQNN